MPTPNSLEFILVSLAESSCSVSRDRDRLLSSICPNCLVCVKVPRTSTGMERFLFLCSAPHPWIMWTSATCGIPSEPDFSLRLWLCSSELEAGTAEHYKWIEKVSLTLKFLFHDHVSLLSFKSDYFSPLCPEHSPLCLRSCGYSTQKVFSQLRIFKL